MTLLPRRACTFEIEATGADGKRIEVSPPALTIVQGLTIGDPPLSRTLGVALASGHVQVYLERGAPLPARRTFTHHTVETVAKGSKDSVLRIPIVQGEMTAAHLCRLVGTLDIGGDAVKDTVPDRLAGRGHDRARSRRPARRRARSCPRSSRCSSTSRTCSCPTPRPRRSTARCATCAAS